MATFVGYGSAAAASSSSSWVQLKNSSKKKGKNNGENNRFRVSCISSYVTDPYKTLRIHRDASESEVKKAYRHLALQYHPDVCKGSNCNIQFHQITEAYDVVMSNLKGESIDSGVEMYDDGVDITMGGMYDPDDMWEEWMGWEGAGIRDYTSHINPYI